MAQQLSIPLPFVIVHFENNGTIRFADKPYQALDCDDDEEYKSGTKVNSYQYTESENQKFVRNSDDTISPRENPDVILDFGGEFLQLKNRSKIKTENLLVFYFPE